MSVHMVLTPDTAREFTIASVSAETADTPAEPSGAAASLKTGMSGEVISESALNYGHILSTEDPRSIPVPSRQDHSFLDRVIDQASAPPQALATGKVDNEDDICTALLEYLNSRHLQFNSRTAFRNHGPWRSAIAKRVAEHKPIQVIIPIFCNIGNPLKRFNETTVTAAEKVTLKFLANVARQVQKIYTPGLSFEVIVDANFYSTPFMNSVIETNAYLKGLFSYVETAGLGDCIHIHDMMDLLSNRSRDFTDRFNHWMNVFDDRPRGEREPTVLSWERSMISSINMRHLGHDYGALYSCYSERPSDLRLETLRRARKSLDIYRALKNAAADIHWENLIDSDCIRSTIHTKSIPVLGLRVYPEYKKSSRLLPYHGIAVFSRKSSTAEFRMQVMPEMEAVTLANVVRIVDAHGVTQAYVANDGEAALQEAA